MPTAKLRYLDRETDCMADALLTTEHAASSYGHPVLVLANGTAYGPSDSLPESYKHDATARDLVNRIAGSLTTIDDEGCFDDDGHPVDVVAELHALRDKFVG